MDSAGLPDAGAQVRRKTDGMLGEVYALDPARELISLRWPTIPGAYAYEDCTPPEFARQWELTGVHIDPPRNTGFAPAAIACAVLLFFAFVFFHANTSAYVAYQPYQPVSTGSAAMLKDGRALDARYGLEGAQICAAGADDYIRSIARFRFRWEGGPAPANRFDGFLPAVTAPGVLTLTTDKAQLSNGFGVFAPIEIFCNYDTQEREALSYAVRPDVE